MVKPGDTVKAEDPLVTLESDKATMDVPSPVAGTVKALKVKVGDKVSEGSVILLLDAGAGAAAARPRQPEDRGVGAAGADAARPRGVAEVRVPDIGDFKDVPVIEVLVKAGDTVKAEDPLVTLESDKATMDVPAPLGGKVEALNVKVGDKVSEGTRGPDARDRQHAPAIRSRPKPLRTPPRLQRRQRPPARRSALRRAAPMPPARSTKPLRARLRGARRAQARARARRRSRQGQRQRRQGPHPEGRRRSRSTRRARQHRPGGNGAPPRAGAGVGIDLLPWPKVDFAKFGPIETKPLSRIKKISGANLHRNWVMIPHVTNHDDADITELEAFRVQLNKENEKSGVRVSMLAFMIKAAVRDAQEVSRVQRLARRRQPGAQEVLPHRLRRRHAAGTRRAGDSRRRQERRGRDREGDGRPRQARARRQAQARPDAGRHVHDLEPGRHRRHLLHADHQRAGGRDHGRVPLVLETGVERRQDVAWRFVLPLSLSWDHRVIDGAAAARFNSHFAALLADMRRALI